MGASGADWFFLAMAHWRRDEKDQSRSWYDKAVAWTDQNQPKDPELARFRAEAAALIEHAKHRSQTSSNASRV